MPGPIELLILLFIVFLIMGPKRITGMFRALGRGAHDFVEQFGRDKEDKGIKDKEDKAPKRKT
ncbi:hypothetical protein BH23ACT11_BH23ACT11_10860 [soil metagenome]